MINKIRGHAEKLMEKHRRNRSEQGTFEKYVGPVFAVITLMSFLIIPESRLESSMKYFFILAMFYATSLYWSVRKTRREVIDKNKEIEKKNEMIIEEKRKVEEKQKEILDSIQYAKRLQASLLPRDLYIENKLNSLKENPS